MKWLIVTLYNTRSVLSGCSCSAAAVKFPAKSNCYSHRGLRVWVCVYVWDQVLTIFTWLFLANHAWVPTRVSRLFPIAYGTVYWRLHFFMFLLWSWKMEMCDVYVRTKNYACRFENSSIFAISSCDYKFDGF